MLTACGCAALLAGLAAAGGELDWREFGPDPAPAALTWRAFDAEMAADAPHVAVVDVYCPSEDWCRVCLRWKHDPRVPESEWIDTSRLPFRLRFIADDSLDSYPRFGFRHADGAYRRYWEISADRLVEIWQARADAR